MISLPSPTYRHGHRPTIGVLTGWQFYHTATNLSYLEPVFRGISRAAQDLGCNLLLGCGMGSSASASDPLRPAWPIPFSDADFVPVGPWNTDGLIIANPLHSLERSDYVQELIRAGLPVLFLGAGESGPAIVADNAGGILKAIHHLVEHGHQQIAFIAGSLEDMAGDTGERLQAYQLARERYGLNQDPRLIAYGRHVFDGGYSAIQQIMVSGVPFTAVLASNDESAMGAMQALKDAGKQIPNEVAIIGFDNRPEGVVQIPALTSVHVPLFNMGYQAVKRLLQHLDGGSPLGEQEQVETRLVLRGSCGCDVHQDLASIEHAKNQAEFVEAVSETLFSQVHDLTQQECQSFSRQLVETFVVGVRENHKTLFLQTLIEALRYTAEKGNDLEIWQNSISFIRRGVEKRLIALETTSASRINEFINEARMVISTHIQRQHRQYVVDERASSSYLSRLTADLLTALNEAQIYDALKKHLPDMGIHTAILGFFKADQGERFATCILRDVIDQEKVQQIQCQDFPPPDFFASTDPFQLTLIPLLEQTEQTGFVAFGTEHLELYGSVVQQLAGALKTVALYRQATEGRQLAEEANRMKSRFLSTISHELRTPLNLILGLSGVLLQDSDENKTPLPDPAQKDVERIYAYAQHLGGLIGDVLDLATSDAGKLKLSYEPLDLGQALGIIATSGMQLAADKGLTWHTNLPETGPWVMGDRTRLRQVALNLINNAIKFTAEGSVRMTIETQNDQVMVYVQDTGLGISSDEQAVIFDEFYRSERSISLGHTGLGLGLAISKRLIEMHGGSIGVRASADAQGSTFYFTLPTIPAPNKPALPLVSSFSSAYHLLLLTNDKDTSQQFIRRLQPATPQVTVMLMNEVSDWQQRLLDSSPDVIVLDITVAPELGWHTLTTIKTNPMTRHIPVMFYCASQTGEALINFDYITKPVEQNELTDAIEQSWAMAGRDKERRTILIVDDDLSTLELHARIIRSYSSSVQLLMARNGREALDILQRETVDLMLLDLQMPDIDGFAVLEAMQVNAQWRAIPVIVVTGKSLTEADMERLNRGVTVVLGKGLFSMEETMRHIGAALERKKKLSRDAKHLVRMAMAYLHTHFANPLTREDIASHVGITEDYLTFCFRQELGTTPIKYLRRFRVNQARSLLKQSDKSITEIAIEVGFSDSGYFSRVFRQETGVSPETFRLS